MVEKILGLLLYLVILGFIIFRWESPGLNADPAMLHSLAEGTHKGYTLPGSQFKIYQKLLPPSGAVTMLWDHPYKERLEETKEYQDAQNFLAPLVINPLPEEKIGFVYCSSDQAAARRMAETGYVMIYKIAPGKGIILKIS